MRGQGFETVHLITTLISSKESVLWHLKFHHFRMTTMR